MNVPKCSDCIHSKPELSFTVLAIFFWALSLFSLLCCVGAGVGAFDTDPVYFVAAAAGLLSVIMAQLGRTTWRDRWKYADCHHESSVMYTAEETHLGDANKRRMYRGCRTQRGSYGACDVEAKHFTPRR